VHRAGTWTCFAEGRPSSLLGFLGYCLYFYHCQLGCMHYDPFPFCLLAIYTKWFWAKASCPCTVHRAGTWTCFAEGRPSSLLGFLGYCLCFYHCQLGCMDYDPFPFCLLAIYTKWFWASEMEARKVEYTAVRIKRTETENRVDKGIRPHGCVKLCWLVPLTRASYPISWDLQKQQYGSKC